MTIPETNVSEMIENVLIAARAVEEELNALTQDPAFAAMVAEIENLSDDEVMRLLQSEGRGA